MFCGLRGYCSASSSRSCARSYGLPAADCARSSMPLEHMMVTLRHELQTTGCSLASDHLASTSRGAIRIDYSGDGSVTGPPQPTLSEAKPQHRGMRTLPAAESKRAAGRKQLSSRRFWARGNKVNGSTVSQNPICRRFNWGSCNGNGCSNRHGCLRCCRSGIASMHAPTRSKRRHQV